MEAKEKQGRKRFERIVFLKMTKEMYERLREFADQNGLSVSAAIRHIIAETLRREMPERKRTEREKE